MATILVIDDKPTNRDVLRTILSYRNHRIVEASDGAEGLEKARSERPDLVIADILMPKMDGYEMVQRLRSDPVLAQTPVIFYTATYLQSEGQELARACGVSHVITKPSDPQDILNIVDAALREEVAVPTPVSMEAFDREHLRLLTDKLHEKVQELEQTNHRLIEEAAVRNRAEDALRASEVRIRAILDAAISSFITVDGAGNVVEFNPAAEKTFGYRREDLLGTPMPPFIVPPGAPQDRPQSLKDYIESSGDAILGQRIEMSAVSAAGTEIPIELTVTRIFACGAPMLTAYIRNLSEQKARDEMRERSEELEKQNRYYLAASRLKSEFLANMSHELRTPLNAIIGFSQLMHDGKVGPVSPRHKEFLGDILASGRHLLQIINDILDLSKIEAGKMEFTPQPVDLGRIVAEVSASLHPLAVHKLLRLQTQLDASLTDIVADAKSLKQVLYNYLSNAIKFTNEGGYVSVRTRAESSDRFRLEVEDTGIGIGPEEIGNLFREFHQLDSTLGKRYQGTGLGLALTKRIVEAQGGSVGVTSEPGRGSTFFAVLPRVSSHAPAQTTPVKNLGSKRTHVKSTNPV